MALSKEQLDEAREIISDLKNTHSIDEIRSRVVIVRVIYHCLGVISGLGLVTVIASTLPMLLGVLLGVAFTFGLLILERCDNISAAVMNVIEEFEPKA